MLFIKLTYNVGDENKQPTYEIVETNVKPEMISEVLSEYVLSVVGAGSDDTPPAIHDTYNIIISLDLNGDVFTMDSDCGNKGLAAGIIMDIIKRMS